MKKIYLYTIFERFWHWFQAILIGILLLTGFEIHGTYSLIGFQNAFQIHNYSAWTWLVLYVFIIFWMAVTGEWKQYIPTMKKIFDVMMFYAFYIFKGADHPVPKSKRKKHNPLQRITYLIMVSFLVPYQIITGFIYYFYNEIPMAANIQPDLGLMAAFHTIGGFAFLIFLIIHLYMTTTGHTIFSHIKAMFTGWEEVENIKDIEAWEIKKN
ncbi:MAG: cytochrome B [Deltaproteobacteria bacterium]|nr:MAG: cytochrome B [Deltaproteobacteria bacterium]PIE74989.1 MAG: cytochrome B [Deltaproteobacteria bacterium]